MDFEISDDAINYTAIDGEEEAEYIKYIIEEERKKKGEGTKKRQYPAIIYLSKELDYQSKNLWAVLERLRKGEALYKISYKKKSDGSRREICNPFRFLKILQKRIKERILCSFPINENAFGFSRGNTIKAIEPHLEAESMLCVDFKNAFPSVNEKSITNFLTKGRRSWYDRFNGNYAIYRNGKFSWYAAMIISELITRKESLPQGAPTSPIIFDMVCEELDRKLSNLAKNVKGKYTRYADNIFFSFHEKTFPTPLKHAILKIIEGKRRKLGPAFKWHKLRIRVLNNYPIRMLGLNVIDRKICNTRDYKRKIRIRIHHINWLLDHGMDYKTAWQKLHGLMSYAVKDTWSEKLQEDYQKLINRVKALKNERGHQK